MDEEFLFAGKREDEYDEEVDEVTEETTEEETEEVTEEEVTEEVNETKDKKIQTLISERTRRKKAEAELKELKSKLSSNSDEVQLGKDEMLKKLVSDDLIDEEVAKKIVDVLGEDIVGQRVENNKRRAEEDFERGFTNLKQEEFFKDADEYKDKIKEYVSKGFGLEEAYWASAGKEKLEAIKKDLRVEIEQSILNNGVKADEIDVGHTEGEQETPRYTKKEQKIANELGMNVKDVHKRAGIFTLDDILKL